MAAVNYRWKDDYAVNASAGGPKHYSADPLIQDAYGILDASVNFETENWRVSFFGKNLTDESYFYHVLDVAAGYSATSATDDGGGRGDGLPGVARRAGPGPRA